MQRWFGPGPNAPGSHPQQPLSHGARDSPASPAVAPEVSTHDAKPDLSPSHGAPAMKGSAVGSSDQDLEAQNNDEGVIHYRRED